MQIKDRPIRPKSQNRKLRTNKTYYYLLFSSSSSSSGKNFNQDYSPPTPPWETQPTFLALVRGNHRTRLKNQWTIFLKCAFTTYMHTLYFLSLRLCVNISV